MWIYKLKLFKFYKLIVVLLSYDFGSKFQTSVLEKEHDCKVKKMK